MCSWIRIIETNTSFQLYTHGHFVANDPQMIKGLCYIIAEGVLFLKAHSCLHD